MKLNILYLIICLLLTNICIQTGYCCLEQKDIKKLDSKKVLEILLRIEESTEEERSKFIDNCPVSIYEFAEKILKSDLLKDVEKLDYYLRIQPLYPNNVKLGIALHYILINVFMKYKKKPLKDIVESIKDPNLKKRIRDALLDADMLVE